MRDNVTVTKSLSRTDRGILTSHLLALSADDRRLRFGSAASDDVIREYVANIDFDRDAAFGLFTDELLLGGAAHVALCDDVAELGLSVLPGCRRRGAGSALFERSCEFVRNHFIPTLFMQCLADNTVMLRIARKAGMKIVANPGEADAYLHLAPPNVGTIASELLQERLAVLDFRLKRQLLAGRRLRAAFTGTTTTTFV